MTDTLSYQHLTKLREIACDATMYSSIIYSSSQEIADIFLLPILDSSYVNNLKDAIGHFRKFNEAYSKLDPTSNEIFDDNIEAFKQFELLSEHLTRGLVDTYVDISQAASHFYVLFLDLLLEERKRGRLTQYDHFIELIRKAMHVCKNFCHDLRNGKIDSYRLINCNEAKYNRNISKLIVTSKLIVMNYNEILKFLPDPSLHEIYDFVQKAYTNELSIYPLNHGDTPEIVAIKVGCSSKEIIDLNNLRMRIDQLFPKDLKWVYVG